MDAVVSFFKGIGSAIVAVFDFIISFFGDLIYIIRLLGNLLANIPSLFSWMPDQLSALLITLVSIVIIYKILGREG